MREEALRGFILHALGQIAPEADLERLNPDKSFRDQFEFDSVDFLNFALALQDGLSIPIPEEDFPALATLNGCITYILSRGAGVTAPGRP